MSENFEIERLLNELRSDDPLTLYSAMDECVRPLRKFSARACKAIEDPDYGGFVAERLYLMMAAVIGEVEKFHATTSDPEAKVHTAAVLLMLGSRAGVPALLEAVEKSTKSASFAARKLANAGVTAVYDRIISRLWKRDISNPRVVVSLLATLRDFKVDLPPDLAMEFLSDDTPDTVREFISMEWPQPPASLPPESSNIALQV